MERIFRRAAAADLEQFLKIIDERIAWMDEHGIRQWNVTGYKRAFPREYYERALADGDLWALCGADGALLAAACLFEEDRHWDDGVPALYAHNLASAPGAKDAGRDFLRHAAALASSLGKEKLRLDSAEDNEPLARWYESQGYRAVGIVRDGPYRGTLREKSDLPGRPMPVNLLLFDGFEMLDAFGSLDVIRRLPDAQVSCVSAAGGLVKSCQGLEVQTVPASEADKSGLLLLPGGMGTRTLVNDAAFLALLKQFAERSVYCLSVCTGSALLARCGVLDGHRATSNKRAFDWAASCGAGVLWQRHARWVRDGRFYTSSGVSAGIDMALGFAADRLGREAAQEIATSIEYVWNDDPGRDPFGADA